ncbi:MAG: carbon-nitrogen hydrolase family protein [Chloroflexi bacterium]|nr:carbon-nitrogen hydrolase family protein [Chloroflexota bacterium]
MKVALVPLDLQPGKPYENLDNIEKAVTQTISFKPDLICFPEMVDVGEGPPPYGQFLSLAEPIPGKYTHKLTTLAKNHNIYLVTGLLEASEYGFYSSAVLINPSGQILLKHRQVHNAPPYQIGSGFQVVNTTLGRISIAICGDVFESDIAQQLLEGKVDHLFVPMDFCGDNEELGKLSTQSPPAYLKEWEARFAEITLQTGATLWAVNAITPDTSTECGACGGAFVYQAGKSVFRGNVCTKDIYVIKK